MTRLMPVERITAQEWISHPATRKIMAALNAGTSPEEPHALFVGGCVRGALLGRPVKDIDIATTHPPSRVIEILERAGFKTIPTGIEHGTVTALMDKNSFEITTLRKDVETDGRRAVVAFSTDWREDALRRDFTMNTLLADSAGRVYDPLAVDGRGGVTDLKAGRVIFVGDASARIAEDHLRILRFFRFHALYGSGKADEAALRACHDAAEKIQLLSKERITQELFKIMAVDNPAQILNMMFTHNVLAALAVDAYNPDFMCHLCTLQKQYDLPDIAPRLLALAGQSNKKMDAIEHLLIIPKALKKEIHSIARALALPDMSNDHAVKVVIYKCGRSTASQALFMEVASGRIEKSYAHQALEIIRTWEIPVFPVSGNDLIAQGIKAGPELGAELEALERDWIAGGFDIVICI